MGCWVAGGFRMLDLNGLGFRVSGLGLGFRIQGSGMKG